MVSSSSYHSHATPFRQAKSFAWAPHKLQPETLMPKSVWHQCPEGRQKYTFLMKSAKLGQCDANVEQTTRVVAGEQAETQVLKSALPNFASCKHARRHFQEVSPPTMPSATLPTNACHPVRKELQSKSAIRFYDSQTADEVAIEVVDGQLIACVNGAFCKTLLLLRLDQGNCRAFDQDDWSMSWPRRLADHVYSKLKTAASRTGTPCLEVSSCQWSASLSSGMGQIIRSSASVVLQMAASDALRVTWSGPFGHIEEQLQVMPPDGHLYFCAEPCLAAHPEIKRTLVEIAQWLSTSSVEVFLLMEAATLEGQLLAKLVWPELPSESRFAIVALPSLGGVGALGGFSIANTVSTILKAKDDVFGLAFVGEDGLMTAQKTNLLLPILLNDLGSRKARCLSHPEGTGMKLTRFLNELKHICLGSRDYIHHLIGNGALEADVREAVESASEALHHFLVVEPAGLCVKPCLPSDSESLGASRRDDLACKELIPVGVAGMQLAELANSFLSHMWHVPTLATDCKRHRGERLIIVDASDPSSAISGALSSESCNQSTPHFLVLLPRDQDPRTAWYATMNLLAVLSELEDAGVILLLSMSSCTSSSELLSLLEALGSSLLLHLYFQLLPTPRLGFAVVCRHSIPEGGCCDDEDVVDTTTGQSLKEQTVQASVSLWPHTDAGGCLLPKRFFSSTSSGTLARRGLGYTLSASLADQRGLRWHVCACAEATAAVCLRAVGDFAYRREGAFEFRTSKAPCAKVWELAEELHPSTPPAAAQSREQSRGSYDSDSIAETEGDSASSGSSAGAEKAELGQDSCVEAVEGQLAGSPTHAQAEIKYDAEDFYDDDEEESSAPDSEVSSPHDVS